MASSSTFEMEYRILGKTGLKVSVLGLGGMTFDSVEKTIEFLTVARKYNINFIDLAEMYGKQYRGECEKNFGEAYNILTKKNRALFRRSDLVITTKLIYGPHYYDDNVSDNDKKEVNVQNIQYGGNEEGLSRKHLMEGINGSLERMQLKYVDIIYAHRPDPFTSIKEIVRSFTDIIKSGKAFYWGTSMWKPLQIAEAYFIAKHYGWIAPVVEQPSYSMFTRDIVEYTYIDLFKAPYFISTTVWNVLDVGILSGKYIKEIPKEARLGHDNKLGAFVGGAKYASNEKNEKVTKLIEIAKKLNVPMVCLAIGWVIKNPNVTVAMLGASKASQLEEACKDSIIAANKLDKNLLNEIEIILNNKPKLQDLDRIWRSNKQIIKIEQ